MASRVLVDKSCDVCKDIGLDDVPAEVSHQISIDGGPVKNIDVCARDERRMFSILASVYANQGQDLEREAARHQSLAKKRAELVAVPDEEPRVHRDQVRILCPLPHGAKGEAKEVSYQTRSSHAQVVHELQAWEIAWKYPGDLPWVTCTAHEACAKNHYSLMNAQGLSQHLNACSEERIDQF